MGTMKKHVHGPKEPHRILDLRFILASTEADQALYDWMRRDAQLNLRTMAAELRYLVNWAVAQMNVPRQPLRNDGDERPAK